MIEFVVWGISPGGNDEEILMGKYKGKPITNKLVVGHLVNTLENMGCTEIRVQEIDFSIKPDFLGTLTK